MERLVAAWPVDVDQIALVGHSMGGLVARSACCHAAEDDADWARLVKHSVSLGTPHMGAPLEQAVHVLSAGLARLPETRPFANFLRRRSGGIRDLRQGSLVDEDWRDCDPDALRGAACAEMPLLEGATHCFVSATVTAQRPPPGRPADRRHARAGAERGRPQPDSADPVRGRVRHAPWRAHSHFALLYHPAVYEKLRAWLRAPA